MVRNNQNHGNHMIQGERYGEAFFILCALAVVVPCILHFMPVSEGPQMQLPQLQTIPTTLEQHIPMWLDWTKEPPLKDDIKCCPALHMSDGYCLPEFSQGPRATFYRCTFYHPPPNSIYCAIRCSASSYVNSPIDNWNMGNCALECFASENAGQSQCPALVWSTPLNPWHMMENETFDDYFD